MSKKNLMFVSVGLLGIGAVYWFTRRGKIPQANLPVSKTPTPGPKKFGEGQRDVVDQASWESFPASDPPAY